MKLIREIVESVDILIERREDGTKDHYINGIFLQSNLKNKNGRVYPLPVMEAEVARYTQEKIRNKNAYGELDHPEGATINLKNVSHHITELVKSRN